MSIHIEHYDTSGCPSKWCFHFPIGLSMSYPSELSIWTFYSTHKRHPQFPHPSFVLISFTKQGKGRRSSDTFIYCWHKYNSRQTFGDFVRQFPLNLNKCAPVTHLLSPYIYLDSSSSRRTFLTCHITITVCFSAESLHITVLFENVVLDDLLHIFHKDVKIFGSMHIFL